MIRSYKDLIVWQKSMNLVDRIYLYTKSFPKDEIYSLSAQIRRSAISIPSNIAEGSMRSTRKDYRNFLIMAKGSCAELQTQIEIASRQRYIANSDYLRTEKEIVEIIKILSTIISKLV